MLKMETKERTTLDDFESDDFVGSNVKHRHSECRNSEYPQVTRLLRLLRLLRIVKLLHSFPGLRSVTASLLLALKNVG